MRILWDEPKRLANLAKHGFDFGGLTLDFFAVAQVRPVREGRLQAVGMLRGRPVTVIFLPLGSEGLSVVSMRTSSIRERMLLK
ncbi:BrnT family toxin [Amaricoccus sp.]|uniref:BrnT family toxin n=1 Tax=Amaricoccus sp. TaxID=1872485 RepID=UPI0039E34FF3